MANAASVTIQATVLPDELQKTFSSTMTVEPADGTEKWYYKLTSVPNTSGQLIAGYFLDYTAVDADTSPTAISAADDTVKFLYVKNTDSAESVYIITEALDVTAGDFVVGDTYVIKTAGTTDFTLIGAADSNVGTTFTATGAGTGTGTATFAATATEPTGLHLGPNESLAIRIPNQTVDKIHAVSSAGTVECLVAALLDDV
jgi:hypothetical protein